MRGVQIAAALALSVLVLAACQQLVDSLLPLPGKEVVLSEAPAVIGQKSLRIVPGSPLEVEGLTSDVCVVLAKDVAKPSDYDEFFRERMGGAELSAMLYTGDGRKFHWKCHGWGFAMGPGAGKGDFSACMRSECNEGPGKGAKITAIELNSSRPLKILGVRWSSTDAFDHVSQPPPDASAVTTPEYRELEQLYGGADAWPTQSSLALKVGIGSNRRHASSSAYNSTLWFRLGDAGVQLEPGPGSTRMGLVTIPASDVQACGMRCFGNRARETLLLTRQGIELAFLNAPDVNDWCWRQRIPMAASADTRAWKYEGRPLPPRAGYEALWESREAFDHQAHRSCMGY
jgi:hypothetical protein